MVLAASWLDLPPPAKEVQVLELFAGQARLARLAKSMGLGVAAHDIEYDAGAKKGDHERSAIDLNGSAGMVFLDRCVSISGKSKIVSTYGCDPYSYSRRHMGPSLS